jgi:hypothetical protein
MGFRRRGRKPKAARRARIVRLDVKPFDMPSKSDLFEAYAQECRKRAETVEGRALRALYRELALQWMELAAIARGLSLDVAERDRFFQQRSPKPEDGPGAAVDAGP